MDETLLKRHNYDLIAQGRKPVTVLPADHDAGDTDRLNGDMKPYDKPHPLAGQ
jgi:hypothetical protein